MIKSKTVKRSIFINASVKKVWRALTEERELLRWYTWDCEIDFSEGGTGNYNHGWGVWTSGTFEEIVEYETFVLRTGENARTITTLTPENGGVRVTIEYEIPSLENEPEIRENMAFGTYQFMTNLKSVLEQDKDLRPAFWKSWIGIQHTSSKLDNTTQLGSVVVRVKEGTPAEKAGLEVGDRITAVSGEQITSYEDLERMITTSEVNDSLVFTVQRNDIVKEVTCETRPYPVEYRTKVEF
ncbi:Activator of Hsp90 ATPase homolog 1-like protein [Oceanobacillus limi]|uniref:Activator of Hsp90 ATPase homolog 1-like protein n=1 Tax=Oceanobacillus limi TaxID=930131 RepID=A0A1I0ER39_9BACI|nr:SRPBCC domain-containing protein [Oceanobacillus limi]SET47523.1 Activator of Hsp90 ATPase homolog 1-like protein [Oceanobacillus limi]